MSPSGIAGPAIFLSKFSIFIPPLISGAENKKLKKVYQREVVKSVSFIQKLSENILSAILYAL